MATDRDLDLKAAFSGRESSAQGRSGALPERIRKDAPTPVLRPDGSWKARADAVDCNVREAREATKARNEWAARLKTGLSASKGKGYRRSRS